jgi:hypothetical protein
MIVHPGRNLRLWSGVGVTGGCLDRVEDTLEAVYDYLSNQLGIMIMRDPDFRGKRRVALSLSAPADEPMALR